MKHKYFLVLIVMILCLVGLFMDVKSNNDCSKKYIASNKYIKATNSKENQDFPCYYYINTTMEKRGNPSYDYIWGKDHLPHFRLFFWVPKEVNKFTPYSDQGIRTNVSSHGPVEKWSVVQTKETQGNEKLVFVYVPKTFVLLYGSGFEKVIHLEY